MNTRPPRFGIVNLLVVFASIIIVLGGMMHAKTILSPLLLSVFFAVILMPPLRWLQKKGCSETFSILLLSAIIFSFGIGMIGVIGSSLSRFSDKLPEYQKRLTAGLRRIDDWTEEIKTKFEKMTIEHILPEEGGRHFPHEEPVPVSPPSAPKPDVSENSVSETETSEPVSEVDNDSDSPGKTTHVAETSGISETPNSAGAGGQNDTKNDAASDSTDALTRLLNPKMIADVALYLTREAAAMMSVMLVVMVTVIFILLEASRFPDKIRAAFGERLEMSRQLDEIALSIWNYTIIKGWISLATGVATWLFLWLCGIEYALLWGLLAFFFNFIPNVGPIIASVPPILLAGVDQGLGSLALVTLGLIAINFAIGYGIEPKYLGDGLGISGLIVLLSLIFWGWILGPVGMFLSAPLTMILKIVLQSYEQTRWIAILLGPAAPVPVEKEVSDTVS